MGKFTDGVVNKMVDRSLGLMSLHPADFDDTTLEKPAAVSADLGAASRLSGLVSSQSRQTPLPSQPSRPLSSAPVPSSSPFKVSDRQQSQTLQAVHTKQDPFKPLTGDLKTSLDENFPGALPAQVVHERMIRILQRYGFTPENTIFGTSVCSDEINTVKGTLVDTMENYWGEHFPMGGIGGAPYVGMTGFGAFSAHVPENGNVLVLFGPHVGVTADGEVGKTLRTGQDSPSTACGACIAAYNQMMSGGVEADDMYDMQQTWLRGKIGPHVGRIEKAKDPMAELAKVSYEQVEEMMKSITNTNFGPGYLALVGGIQINMPEGYTDYFMPQYFTMQRSADAPESPQWDKLREKVNKILQDSM